MSRFTPVMSTRAIHEDLNMIEVPIPYAERVGRSKLTIVGDGTRFLQSIVWTALAYNPVRLLGGLGVHHFYLGSMGAGIVVLLLSCCGVGAIVGLVEGILLLVMKDDEFNAKYNEREPESMEFVFQKKP